MSGTEAPAAVAMDGAAIDLQAEFAASNIQEGRSRVVRYTTTAL